MKRNLACVCVGAAITLTAGAAEVTDEYKALVDARFEAQEKWTRENMLAQEERVRVALQAADKATEKAERAANARFESVNEFRAALSDQTATFITRQEALAYMFAIGAFAAWLQRKSTNQK